MPNEIIVVRKDEFFNVNPYDHKNRDFREYSYVSIFSGRDERGGKIVKAIEAGVDIIEREGMYVGDAHIYGGTGSMGLCIILSRKDINPVEEGIKEKMDKMTFGKSFSSDFFNYTRKTDKNEYCEGIKEYLKLSSESICFLNAIGFSILPMLECTHELTSSGAVFEVTMKPFLKKIYEEGGSKTFSGLLIALMDDKEKEYKYSLQFERQH